MRDGVREARLSWFGNVKRNETRYAGISMLKRELSCDRKRKRPKRRFMGVVREDLQVAGKVVEGRKRFKQMICCGDE